MAGRPKVNIDWDKVDKLLEAHCGGTGIAGILGIHPNTLYNQCKRKKRCNFSEYSSKKKQHGKELLRAKQFEMAMGGDKTMVIWLGKQYLDQSDKTQTDVIERRDATAALFGPVLAEIEQEKGKDDLKIEPVIDPKIETIATGTDSK